MKKRLGHYLAVATVLALVSSAALSLDLFDQLGEASVDPQPSVTLLAAQRKG